MESKSVLFVGVRDGEVVEGCCQWLNVFVFSGLGGSGGVELGTAAAIGVGVRPLGFWGIKRSKAARFRYFGGRLGFRFSLGF